MIKKFIFTFIILISLIFSAPVTGREIVDRIVAVVNEDIISLYDLSRAVKPFERRIKASGYSLEQERQMLFKVQKEILNKLIEERLSGQEAGRFKIVVTDNEVDGTIERIKKINYYTDEDLVVALDKEGLSVEEYRKQIKDQILRKKLVNRQINSKIVVTKADIESYYKEHLSEYGQKKKYRLRHIIMRVSVDTTESDKQHISLKMRKILTDLKDGKSFEMLARINSELSAKEGGDIGEFNFEELAPPLQNALSGKGEKTFTGILETDLGFQIFFIDAIKMTDAKPLEMVSDEIREKLYRQQIEIKYRSWLTELRKKSHIKIIK
jgi:peptidyl-prolyl cis-trans isomerase SurA